jgi:hypothetical protein
MDKPVAFSKKLPIELGKYFVDFFNSNESKFNSNWIEDSSSTLALYGLTEPTMMWERWDAGAHDFNYLIKIEELLDYLEIEYTDFSSYIKREYIPVGTHVDSELDTSKNIEPHYLFEGGGRPDDGPGYSVILPINTYGLKHDTIAFKPTVTGNPELLEKLHDYFSNGKPASDWKMHSNECNLDYDDYNHVHMNNIKEGKCILDYLEVEKVLEWQEHTAIAFNKTNLHTSINFRRHGITHKDFVLVHTSSYPYS